MIKKTKLLKGFTLVEIILYMVLLSIFLITLVDILVSVLDVQLESQATSAVDIDSRFISSRLNYDILRASAISTPANLGDTASSLALTIGGVQYTYSLSGGNLVLNDSSTSNNLNSSQSTMVSISFQKIGNTGGKETIHVVYTLQSETTRASGKESRTIDTVFGRR
jgi:type II secretory pathway component PulJ